MQSYWGTIAIKEKSLTIVIKEQHLVQINNIRTQGCGGNGRYWDRRAVRLGLGKGLQFGREHEEWTLEEWKKVITLMSPDLLCSRMMHPSWATVPACGGQCSDQRLLQFCAEDLAQLTTCTY